MARYRSKLEVDAQANEKGNYEFAQDGKTVEMEAKEFFANFQPLSTVLDWRTDNDPSYGHLYDADGNDLGGYIFYADLEAGVTLELVNSTETWSIRKRQHRAPLVFVPGREEDA